MTHIIIKLKHSHRSFTAIKVKIYYIMSNTKNTSKNKKYFVNIFFLGE